MGLFKKIVLTAFVLAFLPLRAAALSLALSSAGVPQLSWTTTATGQAYFAVLLSTDGGSTFNSAASTTLTSYVDTLSVLTCNTSYFYEVDAIDGAGATLDASSPMALVIPCTPQAVSVSAASNGIYVGWAAPLAGPSGSYNVVWSSSPIFLSSTGWAALGVTLTTHDLFNLPLNAGSLYFGVVNLDALGNSSAAAQLAAPFPKAPSGLSGTAVGGNDVVTLRWTAGSASPGITSYAVFRTFDSNPPTGSDFLVNTPTTAVTLSALGNGGLPQYFWVGSNVAGLGSGSAAGGVSLTPFATPVAPTGLTVSALNYGAGISVSWTVNADNGIAIGSYYLEADTGSGFQVAQVLSPTVQNTVMSAPCGVSCVVRIRAKDALGNYGAYALTATASIPCAPLITAAKLGINQIIVGWTAPSNPKVALASSFAAYASDPTLTDVNFTAVHANVPVAAASVTSLAIAALPASQSQWVRAYEVDGNGVISAGSLDTRYLPPPTITTIKPRQGGAYLSWTSFSSSTRTPDVGGYRVYYDSSSLTALSNSIFVAEPGTGKPIQVTITALTDGTPYTFAVAMTGAQGGAGMLGGFSSVTQVSAGLPTPQFKGITQPLGGPLNLTWSAVDLGGVAISNYEVYRATSPGMESLVSMSITVKTSASVAPTGIVGETDYYFVVVNPMTGASSSLSPTLGVAAIGNLAMLNNLTATASGNSRVALSWDVASGVDAYQVYSNYVAPNPVTPPVALSAGLVLGTSYLDSNPFNGQTNYYQVSARKLLPYSNSYIEGPYALVTALPVVGPGMPGFNGVKAANAVNYYLTVTASLSDVPSQSGVTLVWEKAPAGSYVVSGYQAYEGQYIQGQTFPPVGGFLPAPTPAPAPLTLTGYPVSITDTGLTKGFTYTYSVIAADTQGNISAPLVRSFVLSLPPAPSTFAPGTLFSPVSGTATLNWSAASPSPNPVRSYDIYMSDGPNNAFSLLASVTGTSYVDRSALTQNSVYFHYYRIFSRDDLGLQSANHTDTVAQLRPVSVAHVTPAVPTGFAATVQVSSTPGTPQVLLSWNPNSPQEAISLYNIQRQGSAFASTPGTLSSYLDTSMSAIPYGATLNYTLQAQNSQGQSMTLGAAVILNPPPPTGFALALDPNGGTTAGLSMAWNSLGSGVDSYTVYRSASPFNLGAATAFTGITGTAFVDTSAVSPMSYDYRIAAVSGGFTGLTSTSGPSVIAGAVPPAVTGLTLTQQGNGIALKWTSPTPAPLKYWIFKDTSPLSASSPKTEVSPSPAGSPNFYTDNNVMVGITYYYGVAGINYNGLGTTALVNGSATSSANPLGLSAKAFALSGVPAVQLTWQAAQPVGFAATNYYVFRATSSGFEINTALGSAIPATTYTDTPPLANMPYYYQVQSSSSFQQGAAYVSVTAYTQPGIVTGLTATSAATGISLSWQPAPSNQGITGYAISYVHSGQPQGVTLSVGPVSSFAIDGVPTAAYVAANVIALNSFGGGPVSVSVMARSNAAAAAFSPLSFTVAAGFPGGATASRLDLSWAAAAGTSSFEIYRSLNPMTSADAMGGPSSAVWLTDEGGSTTSMSDLSVSVVNPYYYALTAVGPAGLPGGESYPVFFGPVTPFNYPALLSFTTAVAGDGRLDLAWNPAIAGSNGLPSTPSYTIYRYTGSSVNFKGSQQPDTGFPISVSVTNFTDTSALNGVTYTCYVTVTDLKNLEQTNPNPIALTPYGASQPPLNLRIVAGNSQVIIQWLALQSENGKYNVYRRDSNQNDYAVVPMLREQGPSLSNYNGITVLVESLVDATVSNKSSYCYTMAAVNSSGDSYKSDETCVTPFNPLDASTKSISLTIKEKKNVELDWTACDPQTANGGYAVLGYRVYRSDDGGSTFKSLTTVPSPTLTFKDTLTDFGITYVYRVVPVDDAPPLGNEGISYHVVIVSIPAPIDNVLVFKNSFNPAKSETVPVQYLLLSPGHAWVKVFTLQGQYVTTLFDEDVPAITSATTPYLSDKKQWDGRNAQGQIVASGVYLIHLEATGFRSNARVAVIK